MKIVVSNNSFVYDELGETGFQLVETESIVVSSGDEALAMVREHLPDLAILDAELPGKDGYRVCEEIKADKKLSVVRVILVLHGSISSQQLQGLASCGCDDVVVYRAPGETLYHHVARLLGLPDPSLAQPVMLHVSIAGQSSDVTAHATHLSAQGVDLITPTKLAEGELISMTLRRGSGDEGVNVAGRVVKTGVAPNTNKPFSSLVFEDLTIRSKAQLADLALWDVRQLPAGVRIALRGRFDETTDFSGVSVEGMDNVIFDVAAVERINSWGARQWIMFLRSLPEDLSYCFVNASTEFIKHCNMVADMLGRGYVLSFSAPYACETCGSENERTLQASSISKAIMLEPPEFRCASCGGIERFDDVSQRFFAFLSLGR